MNFNKKFYQHIQEQPHHYALWINGRFYTYQELFCLSSGLAKKFLQFSADNSRCAILSEKTIFAFQAILGALFSGKAYMPLGPHFTAEKNIRLLIDGKPEILCIDSACQSAAIEVLGHISELHVCTNSKKVLCELRKRFPKHHYFYWDSEESTPLIPLANPDLYAYLMFTSGSTGVPKGIAVRQSHLAEYVGSVCEIFQINNQSRFSLLSELTFDLSIHEIFVCWAAGGTLYVLPDFYMFGVEKFIQEHQLTHWTSVPSVISLLNQLRHCRPGSLPTIKQSFFCGEVLLQTQASLWQSAAPNSEVINLYGPTEATCSFTYFHWKKNFALENISSVPIGKPFPNQYCMLVDEKNNPIQSDKIGELYLSGSQVVDSYWNNQQQTEKYFKNFLESPEHKIWYRTGDLARWDEIYGYIYCGRIDDQWKIRGYRIEKIEIENELRRIAQNDAIAIVPIKNDEQQIEGIIAFVSNEIDVSHFLRKARSVLPDIMIPKKVIPLFSFPKNANGKTDYLVLQSIIKEVI